VKDCTAAQAAALECTVEQAAEKVAAEPDLPAAV